MEFRHIRYFIVLSEELHFRRAAEKLHIAQPALSRQIKELEQTLGVLLFKRDRRNVALTPSGQFLQKEGYQLMKKMDFISTSIADIGHSIHGHINIGCIGSAMHNVLPGYLNKIQQKLPGIHTKIMESNSTDLLQRLQDGALDIVFCRPVPSSKTVVSKVVFNEKTVVAMAQNNQWGLHANSRAADFSDVPFILYPKEAGTEYRNQIMRIAAHHNFVPKVQHESLHASTILKLVEQDLGITILPYSLAQGFNLAIDFYGIQDWTMPLELAVFYKKNIQDQAIQKVIQLLDF